MPTALHQYRKINQHKSSIQRGTKQGNGNHNPAHANKADPFYPSVGVIAPFEIEPLVWDSATDTASQQRTTHETGS